MSYHKTDDDIFTKPLIKIIISITGASCCAIWSLVSAVILVRIPLRLRLTSNSNQHITTQAIFGVMMKKQPEFVITVTDDVYDSAPASIFTASGMYVALVCVAAGFWIWHDYKDPETVLFRNRIASLNRREVESKMPGRRPLLQSDGDIAVPLLKTASEDYESKAG